MPVPLRLNAAFVAVDQTTGEEVVFRLPSPPRWSTTRRVEARFYEESLDRRTVNVLTVGDPVYEVTGRFRFIGTPQAWLDLIAAAANQAYTLSYVPDLARSTAYDVIAIHGDDAVAMEPDPDRYAAGEWEATVVLRSESPFAGLFGTVRGLLINWEGGQSVAGWHFERASAATTRDRRGILRSVASGVIRTTWREDRATGLLMPATLLEAGTTNAWTWSQDLTKSAWTKLKASVTAAAAVAPDGTLTGCKLIEDTSTDVHEIQRATAAVADNATAAVSFYARAGERQHLRIYCQKKDGTWANGMGTHINVATGEISGVTGQTVRLIETTPGGWRRFEVVWDVGSGATNTPMVILRLSTGSAFSYEGDGESGLYLWGLQFEAGRGVATSYVPTEDSMVSRSDDVLYLELPAELETPGAELTIYARWLHGMAGDGGLDAPGVWRIGAGDAAPSLTLYYDTDGFVLEHDNDGSSETATVTAAVAAGSLVESVTRVSTDSTGRLIARQTIAINGGTPIAANLNPLDPANEWSEPRLYVGSRGEATGVYEFEALKVYAGEVSGDDAAALRFMRRAA